jgi:hypothetical protein
MSEYPNISSNEAVAELQRLLHEAHVTVSSKLGQPNLKTSVFFGHQNPSTNRFVLSRLDSEDNFAPKTRDGLNAAGSHADWVIESFEHIKAEYPTLTHRPFDGFPNGKVPLREGAVPLVLDLIHAALEVAKAEEVKRGSQQLIGGAVQAAIITSEGPKVANPEWNYKLKAWQIFDNRLA